MSSRVAKVGWVRNLTHGGVKKSWERRRRRARMEETVSVLFCFFFFRSSARHPVNKLLSSSSSFSPRLFPSPSFPHPTSLLRVRLGKERRRRRKRREERGREKEKEEEEAEDRGGGGHATSSSTNVHWFVVSHSLSLSPLSNSACRTVWDSLSCEGGGSRRGRSKTENTPSVRPHHSILEESAHFKVIEGCRHHLCSSITYLKRPRPNFPFIAASNN